MDMPWEIPYEWRLIAGKSTINMLTNGYSCGILTTTNGISTP
jgi:hypothetical protein